VHSNPNLHHKVKELLKVKISLLATKKSPERAFLIIESELKLMGD